MGVEGLALLIWEGGIVSYCPGSFCMFSWHSVERLVFAWLFGGEYGSEEFWSVGVVENVEVGCISNDGVDGMESIFVVLCE